MLNELSPEQALAMLQQEYRQVATQILELRERREKIAAQIEGVTTALDLAAKARARAEAQAEQDASLQRQADDTAEEEHDGAPE